MGKCGILGTGSIQGNQICESTPCKYRLRETLLHRSCTKVVPRKVWGAKSLQISYSSQLVGSQVLKPSHSDNRMLLFVSFSWVSNIWILATLRNTSEDNL